MNQPNREELVSAWIDGQLDAATAREVELLVASDPALRELADSLRDLSRQLRQLPARSLQRDLAAPVLRQIREEAASLPDQPVERRSVTRSSPSNPPRPLQPDGREERRPRRRIAWGWWASGAIAASLLGVAIWLPRGWLSPGRDALTRADAPTAPATGASGPAAEPELAAAKTSEDEFQASKDGSAFKHSVIEESGLADYAEGTGDDVRQSLQSREGQAARMPAGFGGGGGGRGEPGSAETGNAAPNAAPGNATPSITGQFDQSTPAGDSRRDSLPAEKEMPGQPGGQVLDQGGNGRPGEEMSRSTAESFRVEAGEALAAKDHADPDAAGDAAALELMVQPPGNFDSPLQGMARGGGAGNDPEDKSAGSSLAMLADSGSAEPAGSGNPSAGQMEIVRIEFDPATSNWNELAGQLDPARTVLPEHSPEANEQDLVLFTGSEDEWTRLVGRLERAEPLARFRSLGRVEAPPSAGETGRPMESLVDPQVAVVREQQQQEASVPSVQFVGRFGMEPADRLELFQEQLAGAGQNQLGFLQEKLDQLGYQRLNSGDDVGQSIPSGGQVESDSDGQVAGKGGVEPAPGSSNLGAFLAEQSDQPAGGSVAGQIPVSGEAEGLALEKAGRAPIRRLMIFAPVQLPAPARPAPPDDRN